MDPEEEERELKRELEEQGRELLRLAADRVATEAAQREAKLQQRLQQRAAAPKGRQPKFHPATGRPVGSWEVVSDAVEAVDTVDLSEAYESATAALPPEASMYGGVEWTATRTYADEGQAPSPAMAELLAPIFEPLIAAVQLKLEGRCACRLRLESAFATLYTTDSNTGMADHRDFDSGGRLVACSAILQGYTAEGFEGGGLWMRTDPDGGSQPSGGSGGGGRDSEPEPRTLVSLDPGDLLLLFGAWHEPREIASGSRLVFVFFFHEAVIRMAMDGADALDEARLGMAARREKFEAAAPPIVEETVDTPPSASLDSFADEPEPGPEPEPQSLAPPPAVAAVISEPEPEPEPELAPIVLGSGEYANHRDDSHAKAAARKANAQARLAVRLEVRKKPLFCPVFSKKDYLPRQARDKCQGN